MNWNLSLSQSLVMIFPDSSEVTVQVHDVLDLFLWNTVVMQDILNEIMIDESKGICKIIPGDMHCLLLSHGILKHLLQYLDVLSATIDTC